MVPSLNKHIGIAKLKFWPFLLVDCRPECNNRQPVYCQVSRLAGAISLILFHDTQNLFFEVIRTHFLRWTQRSGNAVMLKYCCQVYRTCHQQRFKAKSGYTVAIVLSCAWSLSDMKYLGATEGNTEYTSWKKYQTVSSVAFDKINHAISILVNVS